MNTEEQQPSGDHIDNLIRWSEKAEKIFDPPITQLSPGKHSFTVELAEFKSDVARGYEYLYVQFRCEPNDKASDRLPFTEDRGWKLQQFATAIGCTADELSNPKMLVGLSGKLVAEESGKWTCTNT